MSNPLAMVETVLGDPSRLLGVVERNVEAKLIAPVLELLGWDLAAQVLWGPQIRRIEDDGRGRDVEADVFVADITAGRLRFVIEAKRWDRPLDSDTMGQARGYLHDVSAQRALVTNGRRWIVIDAGIDEPIVEHSVVPGHGVALIDALVPFLSPESAPSTILPIAKPAAPAKVDLDELAATDPLVGQLIAGVYAIAEEHRKRVYLEPGPKGLVLRSVRSRRVIVPINASDPLKPDLYHAELVALGLDERAIDRYAAALRALPVQRTPEAVADFLLSLAAVARVD